MTLHRLPTTVTLLPIAPPIGGVPGVGFREVGLELQGPVVDQSMPRGS
jgi:hypothetical protein